MEQTRRIELLPAEPVDPPKEEEEQCPTIRFDLPLTEPSESSCSEFSYVELVKKASTGKGKPEKTKQTNGANDDMFGDEHEDNEKLMALAMSFEAKYGPKPTKKKKVARVQDLVDMGEGYDENDPFIDNSEAYDELVPATLTTKHGGFYINSGVLDFREVSEDSDAEFQVFKKKKKIKKKKFKEDGEIIKKKRKKLSTDGEKPIKKKRLDDDFIKKRGRPKKVSPTVTELIKQQASASSNQNSQLVSSVSQDLYSSSSNMEESNNVNIDDAIDTVVARAAAEADTENAPVLPDNISTILLQDIETLKRAAKESEEGKRKFFNSSVNTVLLSIELQVRNMSASSRQTVYAHLAAHLPCGQQTLVKRAKKLRMNEQGDKLREPLQKLKDAIDRVMPALWEEHNEECRAVALARSEKIEKDVKEGKESKEGKEEGSTESDDEKKEEGEGGEKEKRIMKPRKKFRWNDEIKKLLDDIVRIKMEMFDSNGKSLTAEEYLRDFLDKEVKDLWPKGWMQTRMIFKESRNVHGRWTNAAVIKPKKPVIPALSQTAQPGQAPAGVSSNLVSSSVNSVKDEKVLVPESNHNPPAPTLLDYASEKYFSAGKNKSGVSSSTTDAGKESESATSSNSLALSFTTTNMLRTPALEVLKNMGAMAGGSKKPSEGKTDNQQLSGNPTNLVVSSTSRAATTSSQSASAVNSPMNLVMASNSLPGINSGGFTGSSQGPTAVTMSNVTVKPAAAHQTIHQTSPGHKAANSSSSQLNKYQEPPSVKPASAKGGTPLPANSDFMSKFKEFAEKQRTSPEQLREPSDVQHVKNSDSLHYSQNLASPTNWTSVKPSVKSSSGLSANSGQTSVKNPSIGISSQHQGSALSQVYSNMQLPPGTTSFSPNSKPPAAVYSQTPSSGIVPSSSPSLLRTSPGSIHSSHTAMSTVSASMHRPVPTKYTTVSPNMNSSAVVSSPSSMSHVNKSPLSSQKAHSTLQQNLHSSLKTTSISGHHDQPKKINVSSSNDSWSPTGQSMDQSFSQYGQRSSNTHSSYSAGALSPQSGSIRSSGHMAQQHSRTPLGASSPSTPDKLQQKVSLSSSISPTEPLYGGMTLQQLEAQAMAAANMNRSNPSAQNAMAWHQAQLSGSSSAFSHPHTAKLSLPSTTASLYHSAASGLESRIAPNSYHGLNMFDLAQIGGRPVAASNHKVMSPDALLPPGGNLFSHQQLAGAGAALNPHGLSPQNKAYKNPQTQHRY